MIPRLLSALLAASLVALSSTALSAAEEKAEAPPASAAKQVPEGRALSLLIRRTLLTLNDANQTGNYTVLRDVAAPGFQSANNAARLGEIFAKLRSRNLDLAPIMYFEPKLVRPAAIDANGMLRASGFIPTRPQQVNFDLMFQNIADRWRLFGIAINTTASEPAAPSLGPVGSAAGKGAAAKRK